MAWFKVDDKLHSHKKAARAGVAAMGLWAVAGSWCADHLTDGFVPDYIAHRLAPGEADQLAARLVTAGLWIPDHHDGDEGWRFNDWDEYQPTRDDVEQKREKERDKKRKQRRTPEGQYAASPEESPGDSEGTPQGSPEESPEGVTPSRPDPSRTPTQDPNVKPMSDLRPDDERLDEFGDTYPRKDGMKWGGTSRSAVAKVWKKLTVEQRHQAPVGAKHYAAYVVQPGAPIVAMATTWLNQQRWEQYQEPRFVEAPARASPAVNGTHTVDEFAATERF